MREIERFFQDRIISKKPLATQISRSNACRLLSLGPIEGHSVQKYIPHNATIQRRYTPRDSSRQRRHFGKSIPEFGQTHSSVLGCERRPVSASIMSRSCFSSFPVCVCKFSSHYLNNIIFIDHSLGPLATESPCILCISCVIKCLSLMHGANMKNITVIQLLTLHEVLFSKLIQIAKHTYLLPLYSN